MHIHNVDLHYHAGQEREPGASLRDYLEHAVLTGRRVLGVTDHYGLYADPPRPDKQYLYERSLRGLHTYRDEVLALAPEFPSLTLRFAPELSHRLDLDGVPDEVLAMSDYFICETAFPAGTIAENTAKAVERIEQVGRLVERTDVPAFIAHPFRSSANHRLVKRDIEPWVSALEPRPGLAFAPEELARFFLLDVAEIGAACAAWDVPLEVNGNTHYRMLCSNLPATLQMLYAAYLLLQKQGATFVPGSDQHGFRRSVGRVGSYVPFDCFQVLGLGVEDIPFLARIGLAQTV